jgi:hypothetical protein
MAKNAPKLSDRGRNNPEPGPTPGTRAIQRDTTTQLDAAPETGDHATEWERSEQDHLPPRGSGSVHNQGPDHGPTIAEAPEVAPDRSADARDIGPEPGLHSGGTRGPSNDNRGSAKS